MPGASRACAKAALCRKQRNTRFNRANTTGKRKKTMSDIITERTNGILRVEFNRPERKNAMTSGMYAQLAQILNEAAEDDDVRVVRWHGAGDTFCAGNDVGD